MNHASEACLLRIHGRVQGVGFRWAMRAEARRLGLGGWVRNRSDGSVEALVMGAAAPRQALLDWAQHGPPGAAVSRVEQTPCAADAAYAAAFSELATL